VKLRLTLKIRFSLRAFLMPLTARLAPSFRSPHMMHDMMMNSGMMWGMGLIGRFVILVLMLGIAALVKYVFFR
jgi:hypothetical protein